MKMNSEFIEGLKKNDTVPEYVMTKFEAALGQLPDKAYSPKKSNFRIPTGIAAAAALFLAVSGGVYAAGKIFDYTVEQQGDNVEIKADVSEDVYIPPITVTANYLPDGYALCEEGDSVWKYSPEGSKDGDGICVWDAGYFKEISIDDVSASDQMQIGNAKAVINYREGYNYPYQIYLFYPDTGHVISVFGCSSLSEDELIKVCENLTYEESPEKDPDHVYQGFSQEQLLNVEPMKLLADDVIGGDTILEPSDIADLNQPIHMSTAGDAQPYSVTVKNIQISDNVDTEALTADTTVDLDRVMQYIQEGKLVPFERTVDEWKDKKLQKNTVGTTEVANVSVTMEVANMTDTALNDVNLQPAWKTFKPQDDGTFISCISIPGYKVGDSYRGVNDYGISSDGYAYYFDSSAYAGTNHFYNMALNPGETKEVHMSFAIPKDQLEDAYLVFDTATENHETQVVKISAENNQIK